jgi:hypothetical protein
MFKRIDSPVCLPACTSGLIGALITTLSLSASPAHAQYYSYNPYTGQANWLWIARSLMYPISRYSGYNTPFYLANSLIWNASYAANQAITNRNRQFNYGNYSSPEPYYDPRQRTRPVVEDGNDVSDQVVQAQRMPAGEDEDRQPPPVVAPPVQPPSTSTPQAAPSVPNQRTKSAGQAGRAQKRVWQPNLPLAQGFIDLVNSKYSGDISQALFDPQTRSFAKAIGLINDDSVFDADLSAQKVQTVKNIFADQHEDALARIDAVRMLLNH